jgi:hypothetical protein
VNRNEEFVKDCAHLRLAKYRAAFGSVGDLDIIGVEGVKNLKILFPAAADVDGDDGGIQDLLSCAPGLRTSKIVISDLTSSARVRSGRRWRSGSPRT